MTRREATRSEVYDRWQRLFRRQMERGKAWATAADPRTGGLQQMCHNWGNEAFP